MLSALILTAALAQLSTAQVVSVSSVESNSIALSGDTITDSSTTQTITPIGPLTPTLSGLSTEIDTTNSPVVPTHTVPLTIHNSSSACVTVTAAGEPVFTIQTNTALESGCTYTVYGNGTAAAGNATTITTTSGGSTNVITVTGTSTPSTSASGAAAGGGSSTSAAGSSTTSNPAATMAAAGKAGLGLAGLGAAVLLL